MTCCPSNFLRNCLSFKGTFNLLIGVHEPKIHTSAEVRKIKKITEIENLTCMRSEVLSFNVAVLSDLSQLSLYARRHIPGERNLDRFI